MRAILTYHSVDPSGSAISLDAGAFRRHVDWLAKGRVRVVPLAEIARDPRGGEGGGGDDDAVALTFDDGFANFRDAAWPPLHEHGWAATLFVVSGHAGGTNAWGGRDAPGIPTLPLLDWDALGALAEQGVTLGAHSRTHPDLTALADGALAEQMTGSADDIAANTGRRPDAFAYPYGATDGRVEAAVAGAFRLAVTTELRALDGTERPHALPRLDTFYLREPGRLERWGSSGFRRWLAFRAGLRRLRAALRTGTRSA